jgi:hypothetical protein
MASSHAAIAAIAQFLRRQGETVGLIVPDGDDHAEEDAASDEDGDVGISDPQPTPQ